MKTITKIFFLVLCSTLIVGCMPASLTKWDKDTPKTKSVKGTFTDSNGNPIPASSLTVPTIFTYHSGVNPTVYTIPTTASVAQVVYPTLNGDLSVYPWTANGQALSPKFSLVTDFIEQLTYCPSIITAGTYPTADMIAALDVNSGRFSFSPTTLLTNGAVASGGYCLKLTYKSPITTAPGYTTAFKYAVLNLWFQEPFEGFEYEQSTSMVLTLKDANDLTSFVAGSSIVTTNGSGTATATGVVNYCDVATGRIFVTRSGGVFKINQGIKITSGTGIGGSYNDATIADVLNLYQVSTGTPTAVNIVSYPRPTPGLVATNGVTYKVNPGLPSQYFTLDSTTGTFTGFSSKAYSAPVDLFFVATNAVGSASTWFKYQVVKGIYPPNHAGTLLYTQSATLAVTITSISGDPVNDFQVADTVSTPALTGASGAIAAAGTITATESAGSGRVLTISVTASGSTGFQVGQKITSGSTTAYISDVTNYFSVPSGAVTTIFDNSSNPLTPYWSAGNQTGNSVTYTVSKSPGASPYITTNSTTGTISGYSEVGGLVQISTQASNSLGISNRTQNMLFVVPGSGVGPNDVKTAQVSPNGACIARLKLNISNAISEDLKSIFTVGGTVRSSGTGSGTVTYIDPLNKYITLAISVGSFPFYAGENLDTNATAYTTPKAKISSIVNIFEKDVAICAGQIISTVSPASVTASYTFTPNFPSPALGLTFDGTLGSITGTPVSTTVEQTHTIKAINASGSAQTDFTYLVTVKPRGLSYTHQVLLTVDNNSSFYVGNSVSTNDGTKPATGVVRAKIGTTRLLIDVKNNQFAVGASLDRYIPYSGAKAIITRVDPNSIVLNVDDTAPLSSQAVGDIIVSTGGSLAVINYVDGGNNLIYAKVISGSFQVSDNICGVAVSVATPTCGAGETFIIGMNAQSYVLGVASAVPFSNGLNIATLTFGYDSQMITAINGTNINVASQSFGLMTDSSYSGSVVYPQFNHTLGGSIALNTLKSDNVIYLNQGEQVTIVPSVIAGEDLKYTVSASLPPGLAIDANGVISGKVTDAHPETTYIVSASNFMGSASQTFRLKAFQVFEVTAAKKGAPSQYIHKEGEANKVAACRVTREQIESANTQDKYVNCYLESGELDLYKNGIDLSIYSGKGLCDKVSFAPYYFFRYPVSLSGTTGKTITHTICPSTCTAGCVPGDTYSSPLATACDYNYKAIDPSYPNCDKGKYTLTTVTYTDPGTTVCTSSSESSLVECGGLVSACMGGAMEDMKSTINFDGGMRSFIVDAFDSYEKTLSFTGPIESAYYSNLKLANYSQKNSCPSTYSVPANVYNYYAANWYGFGASGDPKLTPWGASNPYYLVSCRNEANDVLAQIRIQVRDWDSSYSNYSSSLLDYAMPTALMDVLAADDYADWDTKWTGSAPGLPINNLLNDPDYSGCSAGAVLTPSGAAKVYRFPGLSY